MENPFFKVPVPSLGEKQLYHFWSVIRSGVSAHTVGANAKETRKTPQSNRRFFVGIFESRSATPANTAMTETGIEVNVDRPIANGTHDASIPSVGHQSQKPQQIPPIPPRSDAIRSHRHPSLDKAVPSPAINAMRISGVFHPGRSRLGGMMLGHQHIAEPAATITMSSGFLCIVAIAPTTLDRHHWLTRNRITLQPRIYSSDDQIRPSKVEISGQKGSF